MGKIPVFVFIFIVVLAVGVAAQDILVEYVEGTVEVSETDGWYELFIGDTIPGNGTVRLGEGSMIELRGSDRSFLISRSGTYELSSIVTASRRNSDKVAGSLVQRRLQSLVQDQNESSRDAVVGGVRASEAVDRSAVTWAGGESVGELMKEGLAALEDESFEDAYHSFYDAWEYAGTEELPEIQFYLGYSAYLIGNVAEALSNLRAPLPDPETEYYDDHLLTLAQIQIEGFAYEDAVTLLDGYIASTTENEDNLQTAYLLKGLAQDAHGDATAARQSLELARDIDPASETGSLAVSVMESM